MPTLGEMQGAQQYAEEEYNRDNYKRWPWGSFALAAIVSAAIFLLAASPQNIASFEPQQIALSVIFCIIAVLLLVPSVIGIIVYVIYSCVRAIGWRCVCQDFMDKFSFRKQMEKEHEASANRVQSTVYNAEAGNARKVEPPPTYRESQRQLTGRAPIPQKQISPAARNPSTDNHIADVPPEREKARQGYVNEGYNRQNSDQLQGNNKPPRDRRSNAEPDGYRDENRGRNDRERRSRHPDEREERYDDQRRGRSDPERRERSDRERYDNERRGRQPDGDGRRSDRDRYDDDKRRRYDDEPRRDRAPRNADDKGTLSTDKEGNMVLHI